MFIQGEQRAPPAAIERQTGNAGIGQPPVQLQRLVGGKVEQRLDGRRDHAAGGHYQHAALPLRRLRDGIERRQRTLAEYAPGFRIVLIVAAARPARQRHAKVRHDDAGAIGPRALLGQKARRVAIARIVAQQDFVMVEFGQPCALLRRQGRMQAAQQGLGGLPVALHRSLPHCRNARALLAQGFAQAPRLHLAALRKLIVVGRAERGLAMAHQQNAAH